MPLIMSAWRIFQRLSMSLKILPYKGYVRKRPKHEPTDSYVYMERRIVRCMMRAGAFNLHVGPVRTKISGPQHILILHVCDLDESKSKEICENRNLSQVCFTDKGNQKVLSSMKVLRGRANQKSFTKASTQIRKICNWWNRAWGTFCNTLSS